MQFRPPGGTLRASNYREIVLIPDENPRVAVINARGSGREGINSGPVAVCEELSAISARFARKMTAHPAPESLRERRSCSPSFRNHVKSCRVHYRRNIPRLGPPSRNDSTVVPYAIPLAACLSSASSLCTLSRDGTRFVGVCPFCGKQNVDLSSIVVTCRVGRHVVHLKFVEQ